MKPEITLNLWKKGFVKPENYGKKK